MAVVYSVHRRIDMIQHAAQNESVHAESAHAGCSSSAKVVGRPAIFDTNDRGITNQSGVNGVGSELASPTAGGEEERLVVLCSGGLTQFLDDSHLSFVNIDPLLLALTKRTQTQGMFASERGGEPQARRQVIELAGPGTAQAASHQS